MQYAYLNNTGRVSSITNPNGQKTVYTYQDSTTTPNEPRLSEIKNQTAAAAIISKHDYLYDAQGQITSWTQQTDANHPQNYALQYDNAGRLINASVTDTTTSALLHQYAYSYDAAGNRTAEQIDGAVTSASYNNLNQLTGTSAGGKMVFSGNVNEYSTVTVGGNPASLDASNNFRGTANVSTGTNNVPIIATDVDGNVATNTYQVVVPSGGTSAYLYDLNGNLTSDPTRTYQWDAKDEMTAIIYTTGANAGNHTEFTYNGAGQRVKIVERTGTLVGSGTITSTKQYVAGEERDANNKVVKRFFGSGEQRISGSTATNYFYTFDHLGSIREMIDSSGVIQARYSYDPYGRRTKVSGALDCDFGFTGYYHHAASGLDLSATRAYDSNLGRFIQRDPSGESSGLNLYAYCAGNPIDFTDASGLDRRGSVTPRGWKPGVDPVDKILTPYVAGTLGIVLAAPVAAEFLTSDFLIYEIGQKTLTDANYEIYSQILDPVARGRLIVQNMGWFRALMPEGAGWGLGIGKTFGTGPTPGGWAGVAGLGALAAALAAYLNSQFGGGSSPTGTGGSSSCMDDPPTFAPFTINNYTSSSGSGTTSTAGPD